MRDRSLHISASFDKHTNAANWVARWRDACSNRSHERDIIDHQRTHTASKPRPVGRALHTHLSPAKGRRACLSAHALARTKWSTQDAKAITLLLLRARPHGRVDAPSAGRRLSIAVALRPGRLSQRRPAGRFQRSRARTELVRQCVTGQSVTNLQRMCNERARKSL